MKLLAPNEQDYRAKNEYKAGCNNRGHCTVQMPPWCMPVGYYTLLSSCGIRQRFSHLSAVLQIFAAFQVPFSILMPMISLNDDALNPDNFPVIGQVDAAGGRFGQKTRNE